MRQKISPRHSITGAAFADFIKTEKLSKRSKYDFGRNPRSLSMRSLLLPFFLLGFLVILGIRLLNLQIFSGSYYRNLSDSNRLRTSIIHAPRGIIFDRFGIPLVFNMPGFREFVNGKTILLSKEQALQKLALAKDTIEIDSLRQYPYKESMAHVLGYIGQVSQDELGILSSRDYHAGDLIGKSGIEKQYEQKLRGTDGKKLVEVDSRGNTIRDLGITDPTAGQDIVLTLDAKLQKAVFSAMKDVKKGSAIVSTPQGEILALLSKPSFDPNLFTLGDHYKAASDAAYTYVDTILRDSENQPFLNRAISGEYPPGSTFKLITAASGLEDKVIDDHFTINDTGIITVGQFSFANWYYTQYGRTEGEVGVVKAIKRSNDIFFYKLADMVGVERLSAMAKKFGLGDRLGIDLPAEEKGLVPTPEWKKKRFGEGWYLGDNYHYGIGQGYLLTTPLQVNGWTQAIANAGTLYQPQLIKNTTNTTNNTNEPIRKNLLSQKDFELIRQGMIESCNTGGVAWPLFEFRIKNSQLRIDGKNILEDPTATSSAEGSSYRKVSIACKTGTAQHGGEETLPHAWITLFAPAYNPQIVVTVLSESSGEGSNIAAPIAKKILEEWFSR